MSAKDSGSKELMCSKKQTKKEGMMGLVSEFAPGGLRRNDARGDLIKEICLAL